MVYENKKSSVDVLLFYVLTSRIETTF